jgi:hypothetical protein
MSDILADYREWRDAQPGSLKTHSDRCHLWHRDCMIHRLAAALERAISGAGKSAEKANTPPTLTDEERTAIGLARSVFEDYKMSRLHSAADEVLERLLERTK